MDGLSWTTASVALIQASDGLGHVIVATARPTVRTRHDRRSPGKRAEETCGQRVWPGLRPGHNASQRPGHNAGTRIENRENPPHPRRQRSVLGSTKAVRLLSIAPHCGTVSQPLVVARSPDRATAADRRSPPPKTLVIIRCG